MSASCMSASLPAAQGLQAHQGRGALPVRAADVDGEADQGALGVPEGQRQEPQHVPQPASSWQATPEGTATQRPQAALDDGRLPEPGVRARGVPGGGGQPGAPLTPHGAGPPFPASHRPAEVPPRGRKADPDSPPRPRGIVPGERQFAVFSLASPLLIPQTSAHPSAELRLICATRAADRPCPRSQGDSPGLT
jgi:hypothetical protein